MKCLDFVINVLRFYTQKEGSEATVIHALAQKLIFLIPHVYLFLFILPGVGGCSVPLALITEHGRRKRCCKGSLALQT